MASSSLTRTLTGRGRYIHVSKTPSDCMAKRLHWTGFFGSRQSVPGKTLNIGRNKAKREHRASKSSRKFWRRVA